MTNINYQFVKPDDNKNMELIADWYAGEWNIPEETTIQKLRNLPSDRLQFQVLMTVDNVPVATGGLYNHISLLDREPRFKIHKNWLALVYTKPEHRKNGYGALVCNHIQNRSKELGLKEIFLFTHTAESLYKRLGWEQLERLALGGKDIVVMRKEL